MKITCLPAKLQNAMWPKANPKSKRQRIKAGEPRRIVRKDRPRYKNKMENMPHQALDIYSAGGKHV